MNPLSVVTNLSEVIIIVCDDMSPLVSLQEKSQQNNRTTCLVDL